MIADLIRDPKYKTEYVEPKPADPAPQRTICTVIGDIRRWSFDISNMPLTGEDAKLILEYYAEKESGGLYGEGQAIEKH